MSMSAAAAAAIAAGVSAAGTAINTGVTAAKNRKLARLQHKQNIQMWNMTNEYNSPDAQMARLKAAGLNPNLVYGTGTVTGNTASGAPNLQYNDAAGRFSTGISEGVNAALNTLGSYQDFKVKGATARNLDSQDRILNEDLTHRMLENTRMAVGISRDKFELEKAENMVAYQIDALELQNKQTWENVLTSQQQREESKARIQKIWKDIDVSDAQIEKVASELQTMSMQRTAIGKELTLRDLEIVLKNAGLTWNDDTIQRISTLNAHNYPTERSVKSSQVTNVVIGFIRLFSSFFK